MAWKGDSQTKHHGRRTVYVHASETSLLRSPPSPIFCLVVVGKRGS